MKLIICVGQPVGCIGVLNDSLAGCNVQPLLYVENAVTREITAFTTRQDTPQVFRYPLSLFKYAKIVRIRQIMNFWSCAVFVGLLWLLRPTAYTELEKHL